MEINLEKRINELEARHSFQEDSIERLSSEVRKQQQEIGILKKNLPQSLTFFIRVMILKMVMKSPLIIKLKISFKFSK